MLQGIGLGASGSSAGLGAPSGTRPENEHRGSKVVESEVHGRRGFDGRLGLDGLIVEDFLQPRSGGPKESLCFGGRLV